MAAGATAISDPSALQSVNWGGGQTGFYDPNSNQYYDSGFNPLSGSDLSQYGAFTIGSPGVMPGPPPSGGGSAPGVVTPTGSGGSLAGLSGIFSGVGAVIAQAYGAARPTITTPTSGTLVFNPQTGGYTTTGAITAQSSLTPLFLLAIAGVVIWLILKEEKAA